MYATTPAQQVGMLVSMPMYRFRQEVMELTNGEIIALAPLFPASWYSWPSNKEQAKAEFFVTQLKHALVHRGLDMKSFINKLRRQP